MARYVVATVAEIPPGERKLVEVAGRAIGVFNIGGEFFALRNRCPHQGGPLCKGRLHGLTQSTLPGEYIYTRPGEMLRCPWHGWEFDIRTGQSWFDPVRTRVRRYDVSVAPGEALLDDGPVADEHDVVGDEETAGDEGTADATQLKQGPYIAETYAVSVEQHYIVIELEA